MSVVVSEYRGDWVNDVNYYAGDLIRHMGAIFGAVAASINVPPVDGLTWRLIFPTPVPPVTDLLQTVYAAQLSQSGNNAPEVHHEVILEPFTATWSRASNGVYLLAFDAPIVPNMSNIMITHSTGEGIAFLQYKSQDESLINFITVNPLTLQREDSFLTNATVIIQRPTPSV